MRNINQGCNLFQIFLFIARSTERLPQRSGENESRVNALGPKEHSSGENKVRSLEPE
jgi:hypothetical protein